MDPICIGLQVDAGLDGDRHSDEKRPFDTDPLPFPSPGFRRDSVQDCGGAILGRGRDLKQR